MAFAARYDLRRRQPCFDFFTWLCHVKTLGASEIVLQTRQLSAELATWSDIATRVDSILKPGAALAGLSWREGDDGDEGGTHKVHEFTAYHAPRFVFHRLRSVLPPRTDVRYTVTLRHSAQKEWRNSDDTVWRDFARDIGALVIDDYSIAPLHLHERMAIYAGARMNFFVPNGPGTTLFFTDYPYTIFGCGIAKVGFIGMGLPVGTGRVPWARPDQRLVWDSPTRDNLRDYFRCRIT